MSDWLDIAFELPFVGGWVKLGVIFGPPFLAALPVLYVVERLALLVFSLALLGWLKFLERKAGIRMVVPLIKLPWVWISWVGVAFGALYLFGG